MIDTFALLVSHGLILLAAWRLSGRADLDDDTAAAGAPAAKPFWRRARSGEDRPGA
ncbi:MAG TPA: hypothetical protein VEZ20_04740 [Allosphingosinicella sp.]|jgi:hypothetical protein|nr:hypothetical protein [Allosphingosinicella sp.]